MREACLGWCLDARPRSASRVFASVDTIEIFFAITLTPDQQLVLRRCGDLRECRDAGGRLQGHRLIINRPDRAALLDLDQLCPEYRGVLSRFDVALEIQPPSEVAAEGLLEWIACNSVLRWRRRGPMEDFENGAVYWQMKLRSGRRPSRNLVAYPDVVNRVTGEPNCAHLELRFYRADTIRRQGIRTVKDLITLDPSKLFARHVKFSDAGEQYVVKMMREAVKDDIERYRNREASEFTDRYRAHIPRRVRGRLHRLGQDRAQHVKDASPRTKLKPTEPPFAIPRELTWSYPQCGWGSAT
jgi:hypothetical protein